MDLNQIKQCILDAGAHRIGVVAVEDIDFQPEFRKLCESNACGMFGRSWMCPPLVGEVEELIQSLKAYQWAVVYQTVDELEDSYDFEGMMAAGEKMNRLTTQVRRELAEVSPVLFFGRGGLPDLPAVRQAGRPALPPPGRGGLQPGGLRYQRVRPGRPGGYAVHQRP